jgi:hypothetical protein
LKYWTDTLGVGPFFLLRNVRPEDYRYRGKPSPAPLLTLALGNSGDLQVEIIQQHDDSPSAYLDYLRSGREGFQHVSSWLTREEYDATMARQLAAGAVPAHEGAIAGPGVRFAYFDTDVAPGGLLFEMSDVIGSEAEAFMTLVRDAARGWDGSQPIRELG